MLWQDPGKTFVHFPNPKSGLRGGARQQHITIHGNGLGRLLTSIFGNLDGSAKLWPFTPSTFRRRWDHIVLHRLNIPSALHLTPGSLRGDGAVALYVQDTPIHDILWRMRFKNQETLDHYLQETAALTYLRGLSEKCRQQISVIAEFYNDVIDNAQAACKST